MKPAILSHFRKNDPRIAHLFTVVSLEEITPESPDQFFVSLCEAIVGQQLSGKVADVIFARFTSLFGRKRITQDAVLAISDDSLRGIGMSWSKVAYVKDLAAKVKAKEIHLPDLIKMQDHEVIAALTKVKGIGPWTAEMFLMFTLGRPDVFSFGDLGLRQGIQQVYGLKKEPSVAYMKKLTKKWMPFRTYAARVLWRYKDST